MVEVMIDLDEKVYHALQFYVPNTEANSINEYIAHIVREWINMEVEEPKDARDFISQELVLILQ